MRILKTPIQLIYDTENLGVVESIENLNVVESIKDKRLRITPLHHTHENSDFEFLNKHFPANHAIFNNFGQSYYFKIIE